MVTKLLWHRAIAKENQVNINYILNVEGIWKGKTVKSKCRAENQICRVIYK